MSNLSSKISDPKIIAVAALIIGLIVGYYVDNALVSNPRIEDLTQTVNQQEQTINTLENQLNALQDEHETLQAEYEDLSENSVTINQYNQLQQEYEEQETEITTLQNSVDNLETTVQDLTEENNELETELNNLRNRYYTAYNPLYVSFTLNNLNVNLTVNTDIYPQNTAVSGRVTITHTNGAPFNGEFKLVLTKIYLGAGAPSQYYEIHGIKSYVWENPFVLGAGSYKISLSEIKDSQGNLVLDSNQLKPYVIYVFQG